MKKIICLTAALTITALTLTACGGGGGTTTTTNNNAPKQEAVTTAAADEQQTPDAQTTDAKPAGKFTFVTKGTNINVKDDAEPILAALGEAKNYTEETSCAFDGLDKSYTYSSFILTTYPDGDKDYVNSVTVLDDTVSTTDGICIGDSKEKVEEAYGADAFNGVNAYIMSEGDQQLTIILDSDKVSSIQYVALFE